MGVLGRAQRIASGIAGSSEIVPDDRWQDYKNKATTEVLGKSPQGQEDLNQALAELRRANHGTMGAEYYAAIDAGKADEIAARIRAERQASDPLREIPSANRVTGVDPRESSEEQEYQALHGVLSGKRK